MRLFITLYERQICKMSAANTGPYNGVLRPTLDAAIEPYSTLKQSG